MFSISYVVVTVKARLIGFDRNLEEAAMDLGATSSHVPPGDAAADRARRSSPAGLLVVRALGRRLRDHVLQRGLDGDVPAVRLGRRARGAPPQVNVIGTMIFVVAVGLMLVNVLVQRRREGVPA